MIWKKIKKYDHSFYYFSILRCLRLLKSILMDEKDLVFLHNRYHVCWWSCDARSQGISSHGIDLNILASVREGLSVISIQCSLYISDMGIPMQHPDKFILVQDCGISSADALEIPQPCTKPSISALAIAGNIRTRGLVLRLHRTL